MVRATLLMAVLLGGRICHAGPKAGPRSGLAGDCTGLPKSFDKDVARATKARDASFAKALAARKLVRFTGKTSMRSDVDDEEGVRPHRTLPKAAAKPGTQEIEIGYGEPYTAPIVELVTDGRGTVYRVHRVPKGNRAMYSQCGCGPITGGGMAVRPVRYVMVLPADVTYGGDVEIEYTDTVPIATWTNMEGGRPCPMPP